MWNAFSSAYSSAETTSASEYTEKKITQYFEMIIFPYLVFGGIACGAPFGKRSAPADDPFYSTPSNVNISSPGDIFDSRETYSLATVGSKRAIQLKYSTTDAQNSSTYAINTVYTPQNPKFPQKLVSVQTWEDASGTNCGPSYSLFHGITAPDGLTVSLDVPIVVDWALAEGYYVTLPDHEGPHNQLIVGHTEGPAGLDGIRAAISYLGLPDDASTVLYGYSGGSFATAWMSNLHSSYAPELNIVGSATGGTVIDPKSEIDLVADTFFSGFLVPTFASMLDAYPRHAAQIVPHLNDKANQSLSKVTGDNFCIVECLLSFPFSNICEESDMESEYLSFPPVADILARESLLNNVSNLEVSVPKFPRFDYHASGDEVVPYWADKAYTKQQCDMGANIQFKTYSIGEHFTTSLFGLPGAIQFLNQALNDDTPSVACGTTSSQSVNITSPHVDDVIGTNIANRIRALNGKNTSLGRISW